MQARFFEIRANQTLECVQDIRFGLSAELRLALRGPHHGCRIQQLVDVVQRRDWMIGKCNFSRGSGQRCGWKYVKCRTCYGAIEGKIQSSLALTLRNSYIAYKVA